MLIAVLADTHNKLPAGLPARLAAADEVWHLGDVCAAETLRPLEKLGKPLRVVRGNCDDEESGWPLKLEREIEGHAAQLIHIPPRWA